MEYTFHFGTESVNSERSASKQTETCRFFVPGQRTPSLPFRYPSFVSLSLSRTLATVAPTPVTALTPTPSRRLA